MITNTGNFSIEFKNSHTVYETIVRCKAKEREFLYSTNKSLLLNPNSVDGIVKDFVKEESFQPYVSTIGLYNNNKELVAIAKSNQPIPLSKTTDTIFEVRFDM